MCGYRSYRYIHLPNKKNDRVPVPRARHCSMDLKQISKQGKVTVPEMFTFQEIMQKSSVNRTITVAPNASCESGNDCRVVSPFIKFYGKTVGKKYTHWNFEEIILLLIFHSNWRYKHLFYKKSYMSLIWMLCNVLLGKKRGERGRERASKINGKNVKCFRQPNSSIELLGIKYTKQSLTCMALSIHIYNEWDLTMKNISPSRVLSIRQTSYSLTKLWKRIGIKVL